MCGIAGFTRFSDPTGDAETLARMGDAIAHRGPDAQGEFLDDAAGLAHRRLSIIDLSKAGDQPMFSADRNLVMVFNGEIYNFLQLRKELEEEGHQFTTKTDSEVILALYERLEEKCLEKLNGMFAVAIWDRRRQELFLARDRLGKKPLYYFSDSKRFVFGSEIKAILEVDSVPREIRNDAVFDYFAYQYVPDPKTIFKNINKLPPGHWLKQTKDGITVRKYWDVSFGTPNTSSQEQVEGELLELIDDSTRLRMVSDVPLGAFLSGGIDSSVIVALMARNSAAPVTTCSIGFDSRRHDEVEYASKVASQYATRHFEMTVKENIADRVESIAGFFDEPFADQSLVPTFFVSQLARQRVTVALAGDGGDENFAGYEKYRKDAFEDAVRRRVPAALAGFLRRALADRFRASSVGGLRKAGTLLDAVGSEPALGFYKSNAFMSDNLWRQIVRPDFSRALAGYHPSAITVAHYDAADADDHLSRVLYTDLKTYLVGDILVKVDRMSMANSLEVRAPLLDYRVVEYAASLPAKLKLKSGEKKYILKKTFGNLLPEDILYRKKMGFSVPLSNWLRNELKPVAECLLLAQDSGVSQFFEDQQIKRLWIEHQSGQRDHAITLWSMTMFEIWLQRYVA